MNGADMFVVDMSHCLGLSEPSLIKQAERVISKRKERTVTSATHRDDLKGDRAQSPSYRAVSEFGQSLLEGTGTCRSEADRQVETCCVARQERPHRRAYGQNRRKDRFRPLCPTSRRRKLVARETRCNQTLQLFLPVARERQRET